MSNRGFYFGLIFMLLIVVGNATSCLQSISCPCGAKKDKLYMQCVNETSDEKQPCKIWASCETCEFNTSYCLTCPPGLFGPTCEEALSDPFCYHPGVFENAIIEDDNSFRTLGQDQVYFPGEELTYLCIDGYEIEGSSNLVCTLDGEWSEDPPICRLRTTEKKPILKRTLCPIPTVDPNGAMSYSFPNYPSGNGQGLEPGSLVSFFCNTGYELIGSDYIICLRNGKWTNDAPTCNRTSRSSLEISCPEPSKLQNGGAIMYYPNAKARPLLHSGMAVGTRLSYDCKQGYRLEGEKNLKCMEDGNWSGYVPKCIEDCDISFMGPVGGITYMSPVEFPWIVFLFVNETKQTCSGVLLDHETVLTAANCLEAAQYCTIYFGKYMRGMMIFVDESDDEYAEIRTSSAILRHPEFNIDTFENNIAIVKFSPNVSYSERIEPICLPSTDVNVTPGRGGYVSGWGLTEKRTHPSSLVLVKLYVQAAETCEAEYKKQNLEIKIPKGMFCANSTDRNIHTCTVESGSPLIFYNKETDRSFLGGLASHRVGRRCDRPGSYTIFTEVVPRYLQWIYQNLENKIN